MVFEKLRTILSEQLGVDPESITPDTNIIDDLGADSLDVVELITALEDEFDLIITDERIRELYTVKDVADFVENLM
jgi:acyl carrier protein